jgi:hypothetical protein
MQELGLDGAPVEDACRAVLDVYGLHKLTQKAAAFIKECRNYRYEPD